MRHMPPLFAQGRVQPGRASLPPVAAWLNAVDAAVDAEPWPFALAGTHRRPVDVWATIRGEVTMARTDRIEWLSVEDYLEARLAAARAEQDGCYREAAMAKATEREKRAGALRADLPSRAKPKTRT